MIFVSPIRVHLVQQANEMYVFVWQIEMGGEQRGLRPIQTLPNGLASSGWAKCALYV